MIAATTTVGAGEDILREAKARAAALGFPFLARTGNLETLAALGFDAFLIYGKDGPALFAEGHLHRFHTGTAALRILQLQRGNPDRLCSLLPRKNVHILDATFGEGKDSLTLSWFVGTEGSVTALEKSPALYEVGRCGIEHFADEDETITAALRRIHLLHADFQNFLRDADTGSYDVVYFDTMFKAPVKREENNREAFRAAASYDGVTEEILTEARRVAKEIVIVKERPFSPLFRLGIFDEIRHKRGQSVAYGIIRNPESGIRN